MLAWILTFSTAALVVRKQENKSSASHTSVVVVLSIGSIVQSRGTNQLSTCHSVGNWQLASVACGLLPNFANSNFELPGSSLAQESSCSGQRLEEILRSNFRIVQNIENMGFLTAEIFESFWGGFGERRPPFEVRPQELAGRIRSATMDAPAIELLNNSLVRFRANPKKGQSKGQSCDLKILLRVKKI